MLSLNSGLYIDTVTDDKIAAVNEMEFSIQGTDTDIRT